MQVGDRVGPYELEKILGAGGMGVAWLARDPSGGGSVVLKAIRAEEATAERAESLRARLRREARVLERLEHEHVVRSRGVVEHGEDFCLVLDYIEGESFEEACARDDFSLHDRLLTLRQVAAALEHAHGLGITHRDLKPANVMVGDGPRAFVLDFGLARALDSTRLTATGIVCGTVPYMAPEQARGEAVDGRADLFSLGMMVARALGLSRPFSWRNTSATYARLVSSHPVELDEGLPEDVAVALDGLLAKAPEARLPDAASAGAWLESLLAEGEGLAERVRRSLETSGKSASGRRPLPYLPRPDAEKALSELLDRAGAGRGGALLVLSHPGGGRTRFLAHAAETCEAAGLHVEPHAFVEGAPTHLPVVEVLQAGGPTLEGDPGRAPTLTVDDLGKELTPEQLELFVGALRARAGAGAVALLLDDLQNAEPAEREWVERLVRLTREVPLVLILAADPAPESAGELRGEGHAELLERLAADAQVERTTLEPIDEELLTQALIDEGCDREAAREVASLSGGNPGTVQALLHEWRSTGAVAAVTAPAGLMGSLRRRWKGLDDSSRAVVRALLDAGGSLSFDELVEAAGASRLALRARLRELESRHAWVRQEDGRVRLTQPYLRSLAHGNAP